MSFDKIRKVMKQNPHIEIKIEHDALFKLLDQIEKLEHERDKYKKLMERRQSKKNE